MTRPCRKGDHIRLKYLADTDTPKEGRVVHIDEEFGWVYWRPMSGDDLSLPPYVLTQLDVEVIDHPSFNESD